MGKGWESNTRRLAGVAFLLLQHRKNRDGHWAIQTLTFLPVFQTTSQFWYEIDLFVDSLWTTVLYDCQVFCRSYGKGSLLSMSLVQETSPPPHPTPPPCWAQHLLSVLFLSCISFVDTKTTSVLKSGSSQKRILATTVIESGKDVRQSCLSHNWNFCRNIKDIKVWLILKRAQIREALTFT